MWRKQRPVILAAILSFSVYLLPIVGPHSLTLLGQGLILELAETNNRGALWIATDIGVGLLLQSAAFGLCYWFIRRPRVVSGLVVMAAIPAFMAVVEYGYLVAIPTLFLVEDDTAPEIGTWPSVCTADDATIVSVPTPQSRTRETISEILVQSAEARYQSMRIPGCSLTPLSLPRPAVQPGGRVDFMLSVSYFVPGHGVLFHKLETSTATMRWGFLKNVSAEPAPIELSTSMPVLSLDGEWIGWIQLDGGTGPRPSRVIIRRPADSQSTFEIDLGEFGQTYSYNLLSIDVQNREVLVARNEYSRYVFMTLDLDGAPKATIEPDGVNPQPQTFLKMPGGWVAWDAYQEQDPYRVRWSLPEGSGAHRILRGRGINSVSANPSGALIAVSVTTSLNIGNIPDSVYVLRASDGSEVFRRYLPPYSRSGVLFPSDDMFIYSAEGKTYTLRIP